MNEKYYYTERKTFPTKEREWIAFTYPLSLGEIDEVLKEPMYSDWRLPEAEELKEGFLNNEVNQPNYTRWYWSNTRASESPDKSIRKWAEENYPESQVVVKWTGKELDASIMRHYGTVLIRDHKVQEEK